MKVQQVIKAKMLKQNKIIAHRSRLLTEGDENTINGLYECLSAGFSAEIDVHYKNGRLYVGHDKGECPVKQSEIDMPNVYVHLKTPSSPDFKYADSFFIESDPISFTRNGRKWLNVGTVLNEPQAVLCSNELMDIPIDFSINTAMLLSGGCVCTKHPAATLKEYINSIGS